jgi:hypothetical protein
MRCQTGLDKVPLSVGSASEIFVLTHYLETSPDEHLRKQLKLKAHDFRNTLYWCGWLPERGGWHSSWRLRQQDLSPGQAPWQSSRYFEIASSRQNMTW